MLDLITKPPLTLVTSEESASFEPDEIWEVKTQDENVQISGEQAQALKKITESGNRGLIWFEGFAISIPHIKSVKRLTKGKKIKNEKIESLKVKFGLT